MEVPTSTIIQLQEDVTNFKITEGYFSDILNAQLGIFSVIIVVTIGLTWLYNVHVSKKSIKESVENAIKDVKNDLEASVTESTKEKLEKFDRNIQKIKELQKIDTLGLQADVYRVMGEVYNAQSSFAVEFIWRMRAAELFAQIKDSKLVRISLSRARTAVERLEHSYQLNSDWIGEFQTILPKLGNEYNLEKQMLEESVKKILNKQ